MLISKKLRAKITFLLNYQSTMTKKMTKSLDFFKKTLYICTFFKTRICDS